MNSSNYLIALTLLTACNVQDIQKTPESPDSALRAPVSPEEPESPDTREAWELFDNGALEAPNGLYADVRYVHDDSAPWTLEDFSIRLWTEHNEGQIDLVTSEGLETYFFRLNDSTVPFTSQVVLTATYSGGAARMTVSPITFVNGMAQVTVCSMGNVCNTITKAVQ